MIAIALPHHIDHFARLAKTDALMRAAETQAALDRAIAAKDIACSAIMSRQTLTAADAALAGRAQDWVNTRNSQVSKAYQALADRAQYRSRRVAADRPYARKLAGAVS